MSRVLAYCIALRVQMAMAGEGDQKVQRGRETRPDQNVPAAWVVSIACSRRGSIAALVIGTPDTTNGSASWTMALRKSLQRGVAGTTVWIKACAGPGGGMCRDWHGSMNKGPSQRTGMECFSNHHVRRRSIVTSHISSSTHGVMICTDVAYKDFGGRSARVVEPAA